MSNREEIRLEVPESDLTQEVYVERPTAKFQLSERVLKYWLEKNKKRLENKSAWRTPFGIFISLGFLRVTSTFNNVFGLNSEIWKVICFAVIVGVFIWLIYSIYLSIKAKSIDAMIDELKDEDLVRITLQ